MDAKHGNELVNKLLLELDRRKVKIPTFAKETGIPKDRIYKWIQERTNPKFEDAQVILAWLAAPHVEKSPINPNGMDVYDRLMETIEARRRDAEALAKKMEQHYQDAQTDKKELYTLLHDFRKSLDVNLNVIQQNLGENKSYLELLVKVVRTNDDEIMAGLDALENQPAGTHRTRAGKKELAAGKALKDSRKKTGASK